LGIGRWRSGRAQRGARKDRGVGRLSEAERRLEAAYSELGRPGHRAAVLLRIMLLQQ